MHFNLVLLFLLDTRRLPFLLILFLSLSDRSVVEIECYLYHLVQFRCGCCVFFFLLPPLSFFRFAFLLQYYDRVEERTTDNHDDDDDSNHDRHSTKKNKRYKYKRRLKKMNKKKTLHCANEIKMINRRFFNKICAQNWIQYTSASNLHSRSIHAWPRNDHADALLCILDSALAKYLMNACNNWTNETTNGLQRGRTISYLYWRQT